MKWGFVLALALCTGVASASTPSTLTHQGRLTDGIGDAVNGPTTLDVSVYRQAVGGSPAWTEQHVGLPVANGYYSVELGSVVPFPADLFADGPWFVGMSVGGLEFGGRTQILAVPMAMTSQRAETLSSAPVACDDPSHYGRLYYDTALDRFQGCDSGGWGSLGGGGTNIPSGGAGTQNQPGRSCLDILQANPGSGDGLYYIDPDGDGVLTQVRCDMTRDGGGWTFGIKAWYQSGIHGTAGAVGGVVDALTQRGATYKISDDDIRAVIGENANFDVLMDQAGFYSSHASANEQYAVLENYTGYFRYDALVQHSLTPTHLTSYRVSDDAVAWEGSLACGVPGNAGGSTRGINCYYMMEGVNPTGGGNCDINLGNTSGSASHYFYMGDTNSDTYLYLCMGSQASSNGANFNHRFWFRERPDTRVTTIGTQADPGDSCKDIHTQDASLPNGPYWIDPTGSGPSVQVQCDMTIDGGGWTLGMKVYYQGSTFGVTGAVGDISDALTLKHQSYKLADSDIQAFIGPSHQYDILATQVGAYEVHALGSTQYVIIDNFEGQFRNDINMPDSSGASPPVFSAYRASDDALAWTGRLQCGNSGGAGSGARGLNCRNVISGPNPLGGAGCIIDLGLGVNTDGSHLFYMSESNSDSYLYFCAGSQASSNGQMAHRFWFREAN